MSEAAGEYNRLLRIEKRGPARNRLNQTVDDWVVHKNKWSKIRGQSGMGSIRNTTPEDGVDQSINSYSLRVRFDLSIVAEMRAVHAQTGVIYDIKQVRHDMAKREWTDLVCEVV